MVVKWLTDQPALQSFSKYMGVIGVFFKINNLIGVLMGVIFDHRCENIGVKIHLHFSGDILPITDNLYKCGSYLFDNMSGPKK